MNSALPGPVREVLLVDDDPDDRALQAPRAVLAEIKSDPGPGAIPAIGDEQIGTMLRTTIGMDRMRAAWAERRELIGLSAVSRGTPGPYGRRGEARDDYCDGCHRTGW